jgi:N-acetylmuramoyl-L-alanine amidase
MKRLPVFLFAFLLFAAPASAEQSKTDLCLLRLTPYVDVVQNAGLYPSVMLAQQLLETGHCSAEVSVRNNNFWGIKCMSPPCFSKKTWEIYDAKYWEGALLFQAFDGPREGAEAYIRKILYQREYWGVDKSSREAFIRTLSKVWATDPKYASKLRSIIDSYDLQKYDGRP